MMVKIINDRINVWYSVVLSKESKQIGLGYFVVSIYNVKILLKGGG